MTVELEIAQGRRALPETQRIWAVSPVVRIPRQVEVGWHEPYDLDQAALRETGAFAVARTGGTQEDLIGELVIVAAGSARVVVYCLGRAGVDQDLSLTRRAFLALSPLWETSVDATVVIGA